MRRLAIIVALLAAGCDDPAAQSRAENVLEHGFVHAQITCAPILFLPEPTFEAYGSESVKMQKLQDGSCVVSGVNGAGSVIAIYDRTDPNAETCAYLPEQNGGYWAEGGVLKRTQTWPTLSHTADIETNCTGFNLEAFGVE